MELFGITLFGPQNFIKDVLREGYSEPTKNGDVKTLMRDVIENSTCSYQFHRPDVNKIRVIDCYVGRVDGFAYGSIQRFMKMRKKGVIKPCGPADMYRMPPVTSAEYGWFYCDPVVKNSVWYQASARYPKSASPNTLILDKARKSNKYATLF